jgi:hypothetical protein
MKVEVLIYNINYHDSDGSKIVKNYPKFLKAYPSYKHIIGESGAYGNHTTYEIPNRTLTIFKKNIKKFYKNIGIRKLKIMISTKIEDINISLLDKMPT